MRWDRLFRGIVIGGAALGGGITTVSCSTDTLPLDTTRDAIADVSDGGTVDRDAMVRDIPREGPDLGPRDAVIEDLVPLDSGIEEDATVEDADPPDVPREGPDI